MKNNNGFTLIELVIVIIVLGVLAATAIPKFINLQHDASRAVVQSISGTLKTAMDFVNARKEIDNADLKVDYNGNTITLENGYTTPDATQMRYLLDMDLPTSNAWTFNWLTVPCDDSEFCIVGNRGVGDQVPDAPGFDSGSAVFFWPNGYVLDSCFAYYANLKIDGVAPVIGFVDTGC